MLIFLIRPQGFCVVVFFLQDLFVLFCKWFYAFAGLNQEGLYRVSGIKSKIDELKCFYDHGKLDVIQECTSNLRFNFANYIYT